MNGKTYWLIASATLKQLHNVTNLVAVVDSGIVYWMSEVQVLVGRRGLG